MKMPIHPPMTLSNRFSYERMHAIRRQRPGNPRHLFFSHSVAFGNNADFQPRTLSRETRVSGRYAADHAIGRIRFVFPFGGGTCQTEIEKDRDSKTWNRVPPTDTQPPAACGDGGGFGSSFWSAHLSGSPAGDGVRTAAGGGEIGGQPSETVEPSTLRVTTAR